MMSYLIIVKILDHIYAIFYSWVTLSMNQLLHIVDYHYVTCTPRKYTAR